MEITRTLTGDHRQVEQVFRRAVFNFIASNDDDHGRNHAFLMDGDGTWALAPAFDLTLASYPLASGFRAARVAGKAAEIRDKDLLRLARDHDISSPAEILERVKTSVARWPEHAAAHGISPGNTAIVAGQHRLQA